MLAIRTFCVFLICLSILSSYAVSQWQPTSGPVLQQIIAIDYFKGNYYACSGSGVVYMTPDVNHEWVEIYQTGGVNPPCASDRQYLYIAGDFGFTRTDDGTIWQTIADTVRAYSLCVNNEGILVFDISFIGTDIYSKVSLSRTHGDTWTSHYFKGWYDYAALKDTTILLGTTDGKLVVSRDFGETWVDTTANLPASSYIGNINANDNYFFAVMGIGGVWGGVCRSVDGINWEKILDCTNAQMSINIGIQDSHICVVADSSLGLILSNDNGTTWQSETHGFNYFSPYEFYNSAPGMNYFNGKLLLSTQCNGLFFLDTTRGSWVPISKGLSDISVQGILASDSALFAGSQFDIELSVSNDSGRSWNTFGGPWPLSYEMDGMAVNSSTVYEIRVTGSLSGISKSTDYGKTWTEIYRFTTDFLTPIFALDSLICTGMTGGLKLSWDDGLTWSDHPLGVIISAFGGAGNEVYAGTITGSLYYSADKGHTWDTLSTPTIDSIITVISVASNTIAIGTYGQGVFISFDHGITWNQVNNGLQNLYINNLSIMGSALFVSTWAGTAYASGDNGLLWQDITDGLSGTRINAICAAKGYVFVGTEWKGIWRRPISDVITSVKSPTEQNIPSQYWLMQNYPNPFNPTTTIQFGLPNGEDVEIRIMNIIGQEVATLMHQHLPAGWHSVQWDAAGCASGIYICVMKAGDHIFSRKLVLFK